MRPSTIGKLGSSSCGAETELLGLHSCPYFEGSRLDLAAAGHWYHLTSKVSTSTASFVSRSRSTMFMAPEMEVQDQLGPARRDGQG